MNLGSWLRLWTGEELYFGLAVKAFPANGANIVVLSSCV
jgi:hypothetical protein